MDKNNGTWYWLCVEEQNIFLPEAFKDKNQFLSNKFVKVQILNVLKDVFVNELVTGLQYSWIVGNLKGVA